MQLRLMRSAGNGITTDPLIGCGSPVNGKDGALEIQYVAFKKCRSANMVKTSRLLHGNVPRYRPANL